MTDLLPQIALVALFVVANAAFAGTELALVSLRGRQLRQFEQRSASGRTLASLARDPKPVPRHDPDRHHAGFLASPPAAVWGAAPMYAVASASMSCWSTHSSEVRMVSVISPLERGEELGQVNDR